ncbi:MAG: biopolymer transporter ExbD [Candidatus Aminicenantes bacterium]|nr:biopolymer transporter ExbD [Candidatus Aminicenantes bacterium]
MSTAEPNVVPLCDVLLVLLIIFMVITPLVQKGIDVKLPDTSQDTSGGLPSGLIVLTVKKDNTVTINQQIVELPALQEQLRQIYAPRQDKTIFLRADSQIPFSKVMDVIDIAKGAGVETLGIIPEFFTEE